MKNIILIAKREFLTQVKKKSFVILTLLMPLLIIGFGVVVSMIFQANKAENVISVIDKSGFLKGKLNSDEELTYQFEDESQEGDLRKKLKNEEEINGLLIIPKVEDYRQLENGLELQTNQNMGYEVRGRIIDDISGIIRANKIKDLGVDTSQIQALDKKVKLNVINVLESESSEDELFVGVKTGLSMLLMYVIFIFILMYGVRVMRGVLEEKNNRVVEILISSVKPFELMMGKILGVTGVALVQFFIWIAMVVGSFIFIGSPNSGMMATSGDEVKMILTLVKEIDYGMILFAFVMYFILGYLFYSSMYAAIGSAVDNETETQQFTMIMMVPMLLGLYGSLTIANNPDGMVSFWLSMIPFTSPMAMIARIPFGVPIWQLVLSLGILLISVLGMIFVASKIYRIGILMYGNKVTMKDLWKWIKN